MRRIDHRKWLLGSLGVILLVAVGSFALAFQLLWGTYLDEQRDRLIGLVHSQARLIDAELLLSFLPIFWAAFIFSNSFKMETRVNRAFGSNLLGVVLGGALEYASNLWGLNTLYLLALGLYFLSMVTLPGKRGSIAMKGA